MEEIEITGVVLNTIPYKEKDKLIHIFSVELGNITAILKGVSSANAKLKFAGQPFCFGKFDLTKSHDFYLVKSVHLHDTFFDVTKDYDVFTYANSMLEICNHILKPNITSSSLFLLLVKSLQNLTYSEINYKLSALKFYCDFLEIIGYKLNFSSCDNCNMKFMGEIKFDERTGTFRCSNCSGGIKISNQDFMSLKIVCSTQIDRLSTIKLSDEVLDRCLNLIFKNVSNRTGYKFKSINFV